jgi:iron complex outermembrane recepter protein
MGKKRGLAWLFTSTIAMSAAAHAQEAPGAQEEEIVVTAQRRAERLIDVPQAVSVLSADDLERSGATQLRELASAVPGLSLSTRGAGENQISLRGVTVGGIDVSATVGTYVDEVPYGSSTGFGRNSHYSSDGSLYNLSRIEVLRGPQGTLYGASSMGGLLKYVTVEPDPSGVSGNGSASVSATEEGGTSYTGTVAVNLPITDVAALRLSGFYTRDGGFIDNPANDAEDVNQADLSGLRADFLLDATPDLSIRLVAESQNVERDGTGSVDFTPDPNGEPVVGELSQFRPIAENFDQSFLLFAGTITYDFGGATLTSISSYQETDTSSVVDSSANFVPLLGSFGLDYGGFGISDTPRTEKFTQEIRLASNGENRIDWILGAFYTEENSTRGSVAVLEDLAGAPAPNYVAMFDAPLAILDAPSTYEEKAIFGDLTFHVTDRLDLTAGVRQSSIDQSYNLTISGIVFEPFTGYFPASSSEEVTTYLANVLYRFSDHSTLYFRYATGYRPGGPNFVVLPTTPSTFEADTLASYEIGYRIESSDRAYSLDAAVFHIDWSDIQVFDLTNPIGGMLNAEGAAIDGVEIAATARPTEGLRLAGSVAYQDASLTDGNANLYAADGDGLPNVPEFTAALDADYEFSSTGLRPTIGASVRYVADRNATFSLAPVRHELPAYTAIDLRAGLTLGAVDAQFFVHNAGDERGELSAITAAGRPAAAILQPRTVGLTLRTEF